MAGRRFAPEFKKQVAEEFEKSEKSVAQLCRQFDICDSVLRRWVKQYRQNGGEAWHKRSGGQSQELQAADERIAELEAALGRATLEVDFLKRCCKRANIPLA